MAVDVSLFPGCSLSGTAKEYGESVQAIFKTLNIQLTELEDWNCCGSSSARATSDELASGLSIRNLEIAGRAGFDVVVPCAACFQRLKFAEKELLRGNKVGTTEKYQRIPKIKHLVDYIWEEIGEEVLKGNVRKSLNGLKPVCYYGCLTVRPPEITDLRNYEDPQNMDKIMTSLGAEVKYWTFKTDCCGGDLLFTRPDIVKKLTQKLLDMMDEAGGECIVTACPVCFFNLDSRQHGISKNTGKRYNTPIFYISELVGLAFDNPSVKRWLKRHIVDPRPLLNQKGLI